MNYLLPVLLSLCLQDPVTVTPKDDLAKIRDSVRGKKAVVVLRGGTYVLPETLVFKAEDSETTWRAAPGETVVLSGGRPISGWKKAEGGLWTAQVPDELRFNQLFIDGKRRTRARTPNAGDFFRVDGQLTEDKPTKLKFKEGDLKADWAARGDVEVVALQKWAELRMPIVSVDAATRTAVLSGDTYKWIIESQARYWVENAPDLLDAPGEWYLDKKTGVLSYKPLDAEDPTKGVAIAPALKQLVRIEGAKQLRFEGITFSHADWSIGPKGYSDTQAAIDYAGAVQAQGAVGCSFENCVVSHVGGYGIDLSRGCKENRIVRCEVTGHRRGRHPHRRDHAAEGRGGPDPEERRQRLPCPRHRPRLPRGRRGLGRPQLEEPAPAQSHSRHVLFGVLDRLVLGLRTQRRAGKTSSSRTWCTTSAAACSPTWAGSTP